MEHFSLTVCLRLLCALACGGAVGLERGMRGQSAGLKTFSLVSMGAALVMCTNEFIFLGMGTGDTTRMAAQVISGIGFLGAGTIMVTGRNQIRGLTTAAALWVNAAVGIALGAGFYAGGFGATALVLGGSRLFQSIDRFLLGRSRYMRLSVEADGEEFIRLLHEFFDRQGIHVRSMYRMSENNWYEDDICIILDLELAQRNRHAEIVEAVGRIQGLRFVEEI